MKISTVHIPLLQHLVIVVLIASGFLLLSINSASASCGEIRNQGGTLFCDYNNNGSPELGESPFSDCGSNLCCSSTSQCSSATAADCDPGSGFIPLGSCLKLSNDTNVSETYTTPAFLVNLLVRNIFVFGGIVVFFMLLLTGFKFVAGGKKGAEDAKQILTATVVGFLLMFSAYWIVQIVKIITGTNIVL